MQTQTTHDPNCRYCPDCNEDAARVLAAGPSYIPPRRAASTMTLRTRTACAPRDATAAPDAWRLGELDERLARGLNAAASAPPPERAASAATRGPAPQPWGDVPMRFAPTSGHIPRPPVHLEPHALMTARSAAETTKAPNAWGIEFVGGVSQLRGGR